MSAVDALTAAAIAAVALYVAPESRVLACGLLGAACALLFARWIPVWRAAWRANRLDSWLDRLPTPLARYARARSGRRGLVAMAFTIPLCLYGLARAAVTRDIRVDALLVAVAHAGLWRALRARASETWLYDDRLGIVDRVRAEWWPFESIQHLRCYRHGARGDARVEWRDPARGRMVVVKSACAAHVATLLERSIVETLAQRIAASLRQGGTIVFEVPPARVAAIATGAGLGVALWILAALAGEMYQREAAIQRIQRADRERAARGQARRFDRERPWIRPDEIARERASDADVARTFAAAIPLGSALALGLERARARARRATLTRTEVRTRGDTRRLAWSDVRRVVHRGTWIWLEGPHHDVAFDRRAWDAVLVPRLAAILAHEDGMVTGANAAPGEVHAR